MYIPESEIVEGTGEELMEVLNRQPKERFRLIRLAADHRFESYEEALMHATNRTTDEVAEARTRLLIASPTPRQIPNGKTLEDMIVGKWPGDETDEQIIEALERLS